MLSHLLLINVTQVMSPILRQTLGMSWFVLSVLFLWTLVFAAPASAALKPMQETEMKNATAQQGFTQFVMGKDTARMFLDIHIETYTTIDAFSGGWYKKKGSTGWDQKWSNVSIGNSVNETMTIDGLVLIADFDKKNNLQRVVFGSNRLQGDLSADFTSYSGTYSDALVEVNNGEDPTLAREPIAPAVNEVRPVFHFNSDGNSQTDMGLFFILDMTKQQQGLQVVAGFDEKSLVSDPWWDSP